MVVIVAAPSLHASGQRYEWRGTAAPTPMPAWLLTLLTTERAKPERAASAAPARPRAGCPPVRGIIPTGERNKQLFRIACAVRGEGADRTGILEELTEINGARCAPPLDVSELERIASSAMRYAPEAKRRGQRREATT
jgi:hypothetical protein